ncbi:hypothetical protein Vafri_7186 [Volvox africanus]|uniref:E2F/DP family winged-helix DNA-binding domain-containing protein n=1 Tax=Volvox africanus TaxID=51714 RepID=A0A8J4AZS6_9CHLO|nr:hypothetical protein Vafri_7186 [Volvox africanus]
MDSDTVRPGRRGRARCSRESSRSAGGLRLFSLKVVEKIRSRVRTTYNAVANELVSDQNMSGGNARDGKSIRRRCYDAINVLLACGLIKKDDKKQIVWRGHGSVEVDRLRAEVEKKEQEVEQKKKLLQDMERKHKTLQALLALGANREAEAQDSGCGSGGSSSACSRSSNGGQRYTIPFMLVQAPARAQVHLQSSEDRTEIQFELTEAPPELHDDCSVVMRLHQHEAERQANQRRGVGPSQATDSGQPTPPPQGAPAAAAAATAADVGPLPCNFSMPEPLGQLPTPQQELGSSQQLPQSQPQQLRDSPSQMVQTPQLQPSPPQQQLLLPQQQPDQAAVALPSHLLAPGSLPDEAMRERDTSLPEKHQEQVDFLANLKPVVTSKGNGWQRVQGPPIVQAQAGATPAVHPCAAVGTSWQPSAPGVAQPPQAASLPPHAHHHALQAQVEFSQVGAFSHFLCARCLEQQLQTQQPCTPYVASDCYQDHQNISNGNQVQSPPGLEALAHDPHHLQQHLHQPSAPALQQHLQHHPRPLHPTEPLMPLQEQPQLGLGDILAPSQPPSLYTFEQMGDEHLPATLMPFISDDSDPLGLGSGSASIATDQLGYMGWPYPMSPDPFSPSAFLVTPSFMQGQCRSEQNRSVGAVQVGLQQ